MRMQSTEAACGPAAVANALKALGVKDVEEADVSKWLEKVRKKNDPKIEGTAPNLIIRAIAEAAPKRLRLQVRGFSISDPAVAHSFVRGLLLSGAAIILLVDSCEHWVVATGICGGRVLVVDAAEVELVVALNPEELLGRWEQHDEEPGKFEGIIISRGVK